MEKYAWEKRKKFQKAGKFLETGFLRGSGGAIDKGSAM